MNRFAHMFAVAAVAATPALADSHGETADPLMVYAAMAKLEANKAEAAGAVMLGALVGADRTIRAEAAEDFDSDLAQIDGYVAQLQATSLTDEQRQTVDTFASEWAPIAEAGRALLGNDDDDIREAAFTRWESLDALDDLLDDQLEAILDAEGIAIDG